MTPVTDPEILKQLNAGLQPVTDPAILAQLNAAQPQAAPQQPAEGGIAGALAHQPGWTYGSVLPLARSPEGNLNLSLPDFVREPILSALRSGAKLDQGQTPQVEDYMPALMGLIGTGIRAPMTGTAAPAISGLATRPEQQAGALVLKALGRDKISPENAAQALQQFGDKPVSLMDVGGPSTARLARTVATLPGEGSANLTKFLSERAADQNGRVLADISNNLANGSDVHAIGQKLIAEQEANASPLYKEAFKANQNVASPEIDKILETPAGKAALAAARNKMQNDRTLMGVPDAELRDQVYESGQYIPFKGGVASGLKLRTLDYVKRAMDDQIGAAVKNGAKDDVRILTGLKNDLVKEMDAADTTLSTGPNSERPGGGLYKQARAAFAGPAQSLEAIDQGKSFLDLSPDELKDAIGKFPPSNLNLFRVGAARTLQDRINSAADNRDAVARVFGNATIRKQIDAVFGSDSSTKFAQQMSPENMMTATNRFVSGGSNTMNKAADISDTSDQLRKAGEDAAKGFLIGGPKGAVTLPAINYARGRIGDFFSGTSPEIRSALADILIRTGQGAGNNLPQKAQSVGINNRIPLALPMSAQMLNLLLSQQQNKSP